MESNLIKLGICFVLAITCFSATVSGQSRRLDSAHEAEYQPETEAAKREIIKLLFSNIFRGDAKENIYLSTKNIPEKLRNEFPKFENLTAEFVSGEIKQESLCAFVFQSFIVIKNKATVAFGNCNNGLGFSFEKVNGKWQFASSEINRPQYNSANVAESSKLPTSS